MPESHKWEAERAKGGTSHWANRDLLGVLIGALGAMAVIFVWSPMLHNTSCPKRPATSTVAAVRGSVTLMGLIVALVGYIYPVVRYLGRAERPVRFAAAGSRPEYLGRMLLGACLSGVALLGTWGSLQWAPKWAIALAKQLPEESRTLFAKEYTQIASRCGAIVGTIIAALLGGWLGRRITYFGPVHRVVRFRSFTVPSQRCVRAKAAGLRVFAAGGITAAFYGWFPLYLPELFPTQHPRHQPGLRVQLRPRAFGPRLSANGHADGLLRTGIAADRVEIDAFPKAGATLAAIYLVGLFIIWLGPETKGKPLPE